MVPFADLLIGATALSLGYSVLTVNARRTHSRSVCDSALTSSKNSTHRGKTKREWLEYEPNLTEPLKDRGRPHLAIF